MPGCNREPLVMENERADQAVLWAIEQLCGDDFCEILDMRAASEPLTGDLKIAHEKLSAIYKLSHSHVRSHSCHHAREDWRKLATSPEGRTGSSG